MFYFPEEKQKNKSNNGGKYISFTDAFVYLDDETKEILQQSIRDYL